MKLSVFLVSFGILTLFSHEAYTVSDEHPDITLPVYHIRIDSQYLDKLYENPYAEKYYEAIFKNGDTSIPCEVRFRGATSLDLPKKSWRIRFFNDKNIFSRQKINLNAEYRDKTLMRNFLTCKNHIFNKMTLLK